MSKMNFKFTGLMAPVFTAFNNDKDKTINTNDIESYAKFLRSSGIRGVLVNGTTGEGPTLTVSERKILSEKWTEACRKHNLTIMVQIGGAPINDVIDLARHAQSLNVDAVLCLPELYFKPKCHHDLVKYLKHIAENCPQIPFLLYHIPMFTGSTLNTPSFCEMAEKEIPNFVGLKYTSGDLDQGTACLKDGRSVFLGADTILSGALMLGFDSAIMTTLNIFPELAIEIVKCVREAKLDEAKTAQDKLTEVVKKILSDGGGDWVKSMKLEFNRSLAHRGLNVGPSRIL